MIISLGYDLFIFHNQSLVRKRIKAEPSSAFSVITEIS